MSEKIYYEKGNVLITASRIVINEKTYAVSGITAVRKETEPATSFGGFVGLFIVGFFTLTITWWYAIWRMVNNEPEYQVIIATSSGEVAACKSKDEHIVNEIIASVNQVIIDRQ